MRAAAPGLPVALLVALLALSAPGGPARAADEGGAQLSARLEPEVIGVDEIATLIVDIGSGGFGSLRVGPPSFALENLEIVAGPSRSENFRFVNGETSRSVSFRWRLRPLATGAAHVRGLSVELGETRHRLPDLEARVEEVAPPGRRAAAPAPQDPFATLFPELFPRREARATGPPPKVRLQAVVEPARPFVGQQAVYSLFLLTQADIRSVQPRVLPELEGFWVKDLTLPAEPRPEWVEVGGERFGRVALLQKAIFPLSAGPVEIGAATVDVVASVAELAAFGAPFGRLTELRRTSAPVVVDVRPLPAAPAGFRGAVGSLRFDATLDPPAVTAGEATTLTVALSGSGNLRTLPDPELDLPAGIRSFPPESRSDEQLVKGRLQSSRTWRYVLVPEQPGTHLLPPVELVYFDPERAAFQRTATPALALTARPRSGELAASTPPPAPRPGEAAAAAPPAAEGERAARPRAAAPLAAVAATAAVGLLALFWRRQRSPRQLSRRRLLARLAAVRHETRPRQAAERIEEAWREYLAERWHLPSGAPISEWGHLLAGQGVRPAEAEELAAFLADVHQLRFAPELAATEALSGDLVERSRALARALR